MVEDSEEDGPVYDTYENRYTESVYFDTRGDKRLKFSTSTQHKEELQEAADELGLTMSGAIRHWIEIGRRSAIANDPRNKSTGSVKESPIKRLIPEGRDNAVDIRDELPEKIEDALLDIVDDDDEINRDGFEVYR